MAIQPALKFVNTVSHPNDEGNMLLRFREKGYTIVSNVFERDSVDEYLEQIKSVVRKGEHWWNPLELPLNNPLVIHPAYAPRLRRALQGAFSWEREAPSVCLSGPGWLIKPANPDERIVHDWHKDGDHWGLGSISGYQYPSWVHAAAYFTDMTPEHGPTYVIPRSHRDPSLSPYDPKGFHEEPFLPTKCDVVLWDQRCWHRASPRKIEGLRVMMNFGFFSVPIRVEQTIKPCEAVKQAYKEATNPADKIMFGGPFQME